MSLQDQVRKLESTNELLFSLVNYLSIRVGVTVSQKINQDNLLDIKNTELKIFKQIYRHILKLKLEPENHGSQIFQNGGILKL